MADTDVSHSGWEELQVPYFESATRDALDDYMRGNGFGALESPNPVSVLYTRGDLFLTVSYYPEDAPRYTITSATGIVRGRAMNGAPRLDGVALWRLSPRAVDREVVLFFTDRTDLKERLDELRKKFIEPIAKPLWTNRTELERLLNEQRERLRTEHEETVATQLKAFAASAFKVRRYRDVIDSLSQVAPNKLSATDMRRLALARKYLAEST